MRAESYQIVDHICRACLSRVLMRSVDGGLEFRCGNCGGTGKDVAQSICCCGMSLPRSIGKKSQMVDASIRCILNPCKTPECPAEIVAKEVSVATGQGELASHKQWM